MQTPKLLAVVVMAATVSGQSPAISDAVRGYINATASPLYHL